MSLTIFQQFNDVIAGFSTRPVKSDVLRAEMTAQAAAEGRHLVRPCLVHGKDIYCITKDMLGPEAYIELDDIDGLVTDIPGVRLTSTHGDCIPLYAYDPVGKAIGLAHAGWKGTALGIAEELIKVMAEKYACRPADIYTYIGPGIGPCHFEFGKAEAEEYFFIHEWTKEFAFEQAAQSICLPQQDYLPTQENTSQQDNLSPQNTSTDKLFLDLKGINKHFFELAGVKHIEVSPDCTYCMSDKYYSYRRAKEMDRMLAYIELK